jgi:hypothetical protein
VTTVAVLTRSEGLNLTIADLREFLARWDAETEHMSGDEASEAEQRIVRIYIHEVLVRRLLGGPVMLEAEVPVHDGACAGRVSP